MPYNMSNVYCSGDEAYLTGTCPHNVPVGANDALVLSGASLTMPPAAFLLVGDTVAMGRKGAGGA